MKSTAATGGSPAGKGSLTELTDVRSHFEFGRNWRSYASTLTSAEIDDATEGLRRMLAMDGLQGQSFLDIGCGSGIHSLAALRLGASRIVAMDIDADSVATARELLERHAPSGAAEVRLASVFDVDASAAQVFDVVYSWGVLHHTGRMHEAIRRAAAMVRPGGLFAFALYRKTWCCAAWKVEKRWYRDAGDAARRFVRGIYVGAVRTGMLLTGRSYRDYLAEYPRRNRGMDFLHDVHDWLGGYPYESISPEEVDALMAPLGFAQVGCTARRDLLSRAGILGSGCDEFLYRRTVAAA